MTYDEHVDATEREITRIVAALARADLDAAVPTCPGWAVRDLMKHVGEFTGLWAHVLCEGTGRPKTPYEALPAGGEISTWYGSLGASLVAELRATPASTAVWTWSDEDKTARFVARRTANELAFHRFDLETSFAAPASLDPTVAADAIDEIFPMVRAWGNAPDGSGKVLHLCADEGDEWLITMTPSGLDLRHEHGDADLVLSGTASDLALVAFGRPPLGDVARDGDEDVLDAWKREFHFG